MDARNAEACVPAPGLLSFMMTGLQRYLPVVAPFLFVFLWSTGFIGARYGLPYAGPLSFLFARYVLVVGLMLSLALLTRAPWPRDPRQWLRIGIAGLLVHATYLGGVYISVAHGLPVAISSVIVGLQPLLTAIGAASLLSEKVTRTQWIGLLLGLVGTLFVVSSRLNGGFGYAGLPAAFAALLGITVGTLYQKRFCPSFDYRTGAVIQFLPCALFTWLGLQLFEPFHIEWTGSFVFALGWLVVVLSLGAIGLLNYLIRNGSSTQVASLFYMVPPCTALIAWLMFDETLTGFALLGMLFVGAGVYLARQSPVKA